jgi:hypothetical protein
LGSPLAPGFAPRPEQDPASLLLTQSYVPLFLIEIGRNKEMGFKVKKISIFFIENRKCIL